MRKKVIAVVLVLAVSAGLFTAFRNNSRADAAGGNCYSEAQGPSAPTICE